ncbi:PilZ domain-containing protein [Desulfovulcanus sp.]
MSKEYLIDFDVKYPGEEQLKRQAYRIKLPGLKVSLEGERQNLFPVLDLSATGMAFEPARHVHFMEGALINVSLWWQNKLILSNLKARIVRVANKLVACQFEEMDYRQELKLDKFILEVQKKMISLKKKSGK